jgi:hypothetical protein
VTHTHRDSDDLKGAMQATLEHDRPAQIEAMVSRYELSIPPTITARRVLS